jgi:hypothetical protein
MTILDIEIALANYLDYRINVIVPNISWGLRIHEVDLLVLTPSNYVWEIEIKTSIADLKADLKKPHGHYSNKIKRLYFAVPYNLKEQALSLIPERAGLFIIEKNSRVVLIKTPKLNITAKKLSEKDINHLYRLAAMRIWTLKEHLRTCYLKYKKYDK